MSSERDTDWASRDSKGFAQTISTTNREVSLIEAHGSEDYLSYHAVAGSIIIRIGSMSQNMKIGITT
jgi:hypothetical protein